MSDNRLPEAGDRIAKLLARAGVASRREIERMIAEGAIEARPAQEDEKAMKLLRMLSIVSRRRWPKDADPAPAVGVPPPKKKAAAPAPTPAS